MILSCAKKDDRIRAVVLNGSRANPAARKDPFQDYDIVYYVTEVKPFVGNMEFIGQFGQLMIMQSTAEQNDPPQNDDSFYIYLMQFADGNRIDLTIQSVNNIEFTKKDTLSEALLDKDGFFSDLPEPTDKGYLPKPPEKWLYKCCCNEFWWVSIYVAKNLWRKKTLYAKYLLDQVMRSQLMKMLTWYFALKTDYKISAGKAGDNIEHHIDKKIWGKIIKTYSDASNKNIWKALFLMSDVFRETGKYVGKKNGFEYPEQEDNNVTAFLKHIHNLPDDATEIFQGLTT